MKFKDSLLIKTAKPGDIRKAGGYRKYLELMKKQSLLSSEKVGRNSKCPCGSDKKYKKCCINK
tara:strand:+ start:95 stop:283 length:189 start_codon:yes stop_codon:yes gene_type:complete